MMLRFFVLFFLLCPHTAFCEERSDSSQRLSYLKENFVEFYRKDYYAFSEVLHSALKEARQCRPIEKTAEFLSLTELKSVNAEFNEFFAESIENLCLTSPECFNEASLLLPVATQERLNFFLNNPVFLDKELLHNSGCLGRTPYALLKTCTWEDAKSAEAVAATVKTWKQLYQQFERYGHCDDGAIGEGSSEAVSRLLTEQWESIRNLEALGASNPAFRKFVMRHINETVPTERLARIAKNAATRCSSRLKSLCRDIEAEASRSISELLQAK
jgi:hypothetical protein